MDVDQFSQYFNGAPVLYLEGRQHPIQVFYTKQPQSDYLQAALVSLFQIHQVRLSHQVCTSLVPQIVSWGGSGCCGKGSESTWPEDGLTTESQVSLQCSLLPLGKVGNCGVC